MRETIYRRGDIILLFQSLPFSLDRDLPLKIGPNVFISEYPHEIIDRRLTDEEYNGQIREIYSAMNLVAPGCHYDPHMYSNYCLYRPAVKKVTIKNTMPDMFNVIICLRLLKPFRIQIAGGFQIGKNYLIDKPHLYWDESPWFPKHSGPIITHYFLDEDIEKCAELVNKIIEIDKQKIRRLLSAYVLFGQISRGASDSYQMAYITLFAVLEALFRPTKSDTGKSLANRVSRFLRNLESPFNIKTFIKNEYENERNIVHGYQDVSIFSRLRKSKLIKFGKLYEITRLCLLGFLLMDINNLKTRYFPTRISDKIFDNITPLPKEFFTLHKMYK